MAEPFDIDRARKQLEELGRRIEQSKPGAVADELDRDWTAIRKRHQEITHRLARGDARVSAAAETLRSDIDELRHGFARWAARVERRFSDSKVPAQRTRKPLGWD